MRAVLPILGIVVSASLFAQDGKPAGKRGVESLHTAAGEPRYGILNINNLTTWMRSDGQSNRSPKADNGLYYPRTTGNIMYQDALVWGAKAFLDSGHTVPAPFHTVRVGGATYGVGTWAGWVSGDGSSAVAANPNDPDVRVYRIRRDYAELTREELRREAADINEISPELVTDAHMNSVLQQYAKDWVEWPAHRGAPHIERNGIPGFQLPPPFGTDFTRDSLISQNHDEPGLAGADRNTFADQVLWTAYNDLHEAWTLLFSSSRPLGLEIQKTVWGYRWDGAYANMYFVRYVFTNKGGVDTDTAAGLQPGSFHLDSLYLCQWSDHDIGSFGDDLGGCDTLLQLGFGYNGETDDDVFKSFSLAPPAVGHVLVQGPVIPSPGDTAIMGFKTRVGYRNLRMDSFATWGAGDPYSDPPNGLPAGYSTTTGQWWKIVRGFAPLGSLTSSDQYYAAPTGVNPRYMHPGNPELPNSAVDGLGTPWSVSPGDRRNVMTTGPHRLHPGESSELVLAVVLGLGSDRLSSVRIMKSAAQAAHRMHRTLFAGPRAPTKPRVQAIELDRQVILEWASNTGLLAETEQTVVAGDYRFEGYNVYQLPRSDAPITEGVRIATFDADNDVSTIVETRFDPAIGQMNPVLLQKGSNTGIRRTIEITKDHFERFGDSRLINGQQYHFAVTAYNYSSAFGASPPSLESEPAYRTVTPQRPFGIISSAGSGDSVAVVRSGVTDGTFDVRVLDPRSVTGHAYEIRFRSESGGIFWDVVDQDRNEAVKAAIPVSVPATVSDGLMMTLYHPGDDFKDFWEISNSEGPHAPTYAAIRFNGSGFPTTLPGNPDRPAPNPEGAQWAIHASILFFPSFSSFKDTVTRRGADWPRISGNDFEIRFTAAGGKGLLSASPGTPADIPFELWNIGRDPSDSTDDYRLLPFIEDDNNNGVFDLSRMDHAISGGDNDPQTDRITWLDPEDRSPGQAGYLSWVGSGGASGAGGAVLSNLVLVNLNGGSVSDLSWPSNVNQLTPPAGTTFRIITTKPNRPGDSFQFTAPAVQSGLEVQRQFIRQIGVFPNPWIGSAAVNPYVTFLNLPEKATIRIFNLAGHAVRTLHKNDPSQFFRWDLTNADNWQVASGMYICHIEMPHLGETKVVKLAVIQPQIIFSR